ncbi:hypothetical protein ACWIG5_09910 [Streptomyces lydicus]
MSVASAGLGVLHANHRFDLEAGAEVSGMSRADVWWRQKSPVQRELVPLLGARLCAMGVVAYDSLGFRELATLPYSGSPIPGNPQGQNSLSNGSVFAVRTRSGQFVKGLVRSYGTDLSIRWQNCAPSVAYKEVSVVMGSAPSWLVTRYVVHCTYQTEDGATHTCGSGIFGAEGGTVTDRISNEGGEFPTKVEVVVALDFQPETGLHGLIKQLTPEVTSNGVSLIFEPNQAVAIVPLVIALSPSPLAQDYLLLRWQYRAGDSEVSAGQHTLTGPDLQQNVAQYQIASVPDPLHPMTLNLNVEGVYRGTQLASFNQRVSLPVSGIALRFQKTSTGAYRLIAV